MATSMIEDDFVARFRAAPRAQRDALFEEVFHAHRGRAYGLCLRLCGDAALAEDAVQEAFLEVYKSLPGFRGEARLGTWIYRVAMRTALRLRSRRPDQARAGAQAEIVAAPSDPDATLAARDDMRRIQAALDTLPAEQRTVIALFSVEGLSHGQIAEVLGVPEGTVWSRLHKGRKALAAALTSAGSR